MTAACRTFRQRLRVTAVAASLLAATPVFAEPVPGASVEDAYALIRNTLLDFTSPPDAMLARVASMSGGRWDDVPLDVDLPADPQALRIRLAMELDAEGNGFLSSRQLDCTRLGPAGLAAVMAQDPMAPSVALKAAGTADFDVAMEAFALQALAYSASKLAPNPPGAVMMCSMTLALAPQGSPEQALMALASADFAKVTRHPEGAIDFEEGVAGPTGTVAFLRISVPELEDGQRFFYLQAFSAEARPSS